MDDFIYKYKEYLANLTDNQLLIYILINVNPMKSIDIKYIKEKLNLSENSVMKILNELEELNLIEKIKEKEEWKSKEITLEILKKGGF